MSLIDKFVAEAYVQDLKKSREQLEEALLGWAMLYGDAAVNVGFDDKWANVLWGHVDSDYKDIPLSFIYSSGYSDEHTLQLNAIGRRMLDELNR